MAGSTSVRPDPTPIIVPNQENHQQSSMLIRHVGVAAHLEFDVLELNGLYVEADCWDGRHHFSNLKPVQDRRLSAAHTHDMRQ